MKRCGACGAVVTRLHQYGLCSRCTSRLEAWIYRQMEAINRDLDLMVAFEAYCYHRVAPA